MAVLWAAGRALPEMGVNSGVLAQAIPFLQAMNWSTLPLLTDSASRCAPPDSGVRLRCETVVLLAWLARMLPSAATPVAMPT